RRRARPSGVARVARGRPRLLLPRPTCPPRPPSWDGRRAARALGAPPLPPEVRAPPVDRRLPGADARLRDRQHRERLLARADRQGRRDELAGAVGARAAADVGVARDRGRGGRAVAVVDQPAAFARNWANTSAISSALLTASEALSIRASPCSTVSTVS